MITIDQVRKAIACLHSSEKIVVPIDAMGKPRMTRADAWKKRKCVQKYWSFKDALLLFIKQRPEVPFVVSWIVFKEIPKSIKGKKREVLKGTPHVQTPDRDNLDKAALDALFKQDSTVYAGVIAKFWDDGQGPRIEFYFD